MKNFHHTQTAFHLSECEPHLRKWSHAKSIRRNDAPPYIEPLSESKTQRLGRARLGAHRAGRVRTSFSTIARACASESGYARRIPPNTFSNGMRPYRSYEV